MTLHMDIPREAILFYIYSKYYLKTTDGKLSYKIYYYGCSNDIFDLKPNKSLKAVNMILVES